MNKQEQITAIIENLITETGRIGNYSKAEIQKAITVARGLDPRTINNWYLYLWKLEYFYQTKPGVFSLNVSKVVLLEIKLPEQIDPKQARLL